MYALGYKAEKFRGNIDNTDVPKIIQELLYLDMDAETEKLK